MCSAFLLDLLLKFAMEVVKLLSAILLFRIELLIEKRIIPNISIACVYYLLFNGLIVITLFVLILLFHFRYAGNSE